MNQTEYYIRFKLFVVLTFYKYVPFVIHLDIYIYIQIRNKTNVSKKLKCQAICDEGSIMLSFFSAITHQCRCMDIFFGEPIDSDELVIPKTFMHIVPKNHEHISFVSCKLEPPKANGRGILVNNRATRALLSS
jgi:hypothetical protein